MADDPLPVLVLQGGGALGSYQAGVFAALADGRFCPKWTAGISIGAINAALIAGNPPDRRVTRLTEFWDMVTSGLPQLVPALSDGFMRGWHEWAAGATATFGAPGFFRPRWPPALPWLRGPLGVYDTAPLRETLLRLVDWDLLNSGAVRLSVGAVNVTTGNFRYFDTKYQQLGPEHIMASGALPPGLPPVLIDGEYWWDGGLVSNTPLDHVLGEERQCDMMIFQVDLFPARGPMPQTQDEADERVADIRFSSRTRLGTDNAVQRNAERRALARLVSSLPPELAASEDVALLVSAARQNRVGICQLIYRDKAWQGSAKGREFSRSTMRLHWDSGFVDASAGLARAPWLERPLPEGVTSFDPGAGER
ncbi:patatin-like phospholipase family protein [Sandarakinorhabdus sp.]|uniref:patatin-like phospholipase family protein n=1 Tax=Sandarakinorhabdus sp. TaxID=1916663 RepID=UPI00286E64B6|nr:patatin-like phospholipase family protein [Sandarakinorhabdus sp.]